MRFRKAPPKKTFEITIVDDNTYQVKAHKITSTDLTVVKKACHVLDKRKTFQLPKVDLPTLMKFESKYSFSPVPRFVQRLTKKSHPLTFDHHNIPAPLWESLFPYQKEGVRMAIDVYGSRCLLADDMGLGKTRQALAFIGYHLPSRTLVVCPSYLRYHWQHALKELLSCESQLVKKGSETLTGAVCIVSYDMLHTLQIPSGLFDVVVCDESHYVKSRKT